MVVELRVDRLVAGGDGIASLDGLKVFVPLAAPQETVKARIIARKKDYAIARIVSIVEPSPLRIESRCRLFPECGGCQLQHIDYTGQLVVKKLIVNDALQHLGRVFVPVTNTTASADCWRYRNKTQYPVAGNGRSLVGFYRRGSHRVVEAPECLLHPAEFDRIRAAAVEGINRWERPYREQHHSGNIRHLVLRHSPLREELLVVLVSRTRTIDPRLVEHLASLPGVVGVVQSANPDETNRILGRQTLALSGRRFLTQTVLGKELRVSANSFFQVNLRQAEEVCRMVMKHVAPSGPETVIDVYSGVGMLTLTLAGFVRRVIGIESNPDAVEDARHNAEAAGAGNVEFHCGDAEEGLARVTTADIVVVDPPRRGCSSGVLGRIVDLAPHRVIYVSCNPATLARDLSALEARGYTTEQVEPVDMFPQTFHVEVVASLRRE